MTTGERGKGQHIVEIDPAKCLGRAGILAGGAKAAEGNVHRGGQRQSVQRVERGGQPGASRNGVARFAAEQEEVVLRSQLAQQGFANQTGGAGNQE